MAAGEPVLWSLYVYAPNKGAPIFFTLAYAVSAVGHIWQCYRYKSLKLVGLHPVCAVLFTIGYAMREYGAYHYLFSYQNLIIFILSQVFIYVCPPLLELANYHVLGRIFYYVPWLAPLPPGRVLATFGGLMAIIEALNALGVALVANPTSSKSQQELGSHLTVAAIAIQLVVIIIFVFLAVIFHRRYDRAKIQVQTKTVKTLMRTLYASMALIFIRCIYRLVEHLGNTKLEIDDIEALRALSPLKRHEWFFYIFEATFMLINSTIWNVWNPGRYLPRNYHIYLAQDGTETEDTEVPDSRSFLAKTGHVLSFGLFFRNKAKSRAFTATSRQRHSASPRQ